MFVETASVVRVSIAWVVCVGALAAFHFGFVAPRGQALAAVGAQVDEQAERFGMLRNARSTREQERIHAEHAELERRYADFVFQEEGLNGLDFRLRDLAEKNGLTGFSSRQVGTTTKVDGADLKRIVQRDLVMSFNGSYVQFLQFVNDLERHGPVVFADQFMLRTVPGKGPGLECSLECSLLAQAGK